MNVLIIPEDFTNDQHVLKPIVRAMLTACGKPRARIEICLEPRLRSVDQALDWRRIEEILADHQGMVDVFLLCVDRDGEPNRRQALDRIEQEAQRVLSADRRLFGVEAWQEVEVWLLAGLDLPEGWNWNAIRQERDPKEAYYVPLAKQRDLLDDLSQGRKTLALEAARHYDRIRQRCPEDVAALEDRVRKWLEEKQ